MFTFVSLKKTPKTKKSGRTLTSEQTEFNPVTVLDGFASGEEHVLYCDYHGGMTEMFDIMKGRDKISTDELFNRVDSDRTRGQSLSVKRRRIKMVVRSGSFTWRS